MPNTATFLLNLFLKPGLGLMRRLRFPAKMALMVVVLTVPLGWLTANVVLSKRADWLNTRAEVWGGNVVAKTLDVAKQTQLHRGLVNRSLTGDAAVEAARAEAGIQLQRKLADLQEAVDQAADENLLETWAPIRTALEQLAAGGYSHDAQGSFASHTQQLLALQEFMMRSAEDSGLLLDPEAMPFHLMHLAVEHVLPWTEAMARMRGQGAAQLRAHADDPKQRVKVTSQQAVLAHELASAAMVMAALGRTGEALPAGFDEAVAQSRAFAERVDAIFLVGEPEADAAEFFDAGTRAIDMASATGHAAVDRLVELLEERSQRLEREWLGALLAGAATFFGVAYLTAAFFRTSFAAIRVLQGSVNQLADGNFAAQIRLRRTDELSAVSNTLEAMTQRLSDMVSDIRSNSSMVTQSGMKLATDTQALSERTEAQASSLVRTVTSIQALTAAVTRSAEGARAADALASQVRGIAEAGGVAIQSSVTSMQDIQTSSQRVQEIIGVIEAIAFQTNILALNAAVEAARAGSHGLGFAVVAAEVRTLAQRSAASAKEIKALIGESAAHVAAGVKQVGDASQTFADIVGGIRDLAGNVGTISSSASEQSVGLERISQAVSHIDQLTQQNAQMVEQALHSSAQLNERAERLASAVSTFRLRPGSADEAFDGNPRRVGASVRDVRGAYGAKLIADGFDRTAHAGG